jgi:hypothetical protein
LPPELSTRKQVNYNHPIPPIYKETAPHSWLRRKKERDLLEQQEVARNAEAAALHVNWGSMTSSDESESDNGDEFKNAPEVVELIYDDNDQRRSTDLPVLIYLGDETRDVGNKVQVFKKDMYHWNQWINEAQLIQQGKTSTFQSAAKRIGSSAHNSYTSYSKTARRHQRMMPKLSQQKRQIARMRRPGSQQKQTPGVWKSTDKRYQRFWKTAFNVKNA